MDYGKVISADIQQKFNISEEARVQLEKNINRQISFCLKYELVSPLSKRVNRKLHTEYQSIKEHFKGQIRKNKLLIRSIHREKKRRLDELENLLNIPSEKRFFNNYVASDEVLFIDISKKSI